MKISDFLRKEAVNTDLKSETKMDVISEMVTMLVEGGIIEKKHKSKIIIGYYRRVMSYLGEFTVKIGKFTL